MRQVIGTENLPIKIWTSFAEEECLAQARNLANLPFAFKHVALMPDCHAGYGMPIGGVLATEGVVIPNAVGVDIGCGMCAVKTNLTDIDTETLKLVMGKIRERVPVGFNKHQQPQDADLMPNYLMGEICGREFDNALLSLGTLGGGNHFIEIQQGDDGHVWIMVHSGSRNLGKQVADHYNKLAVELNKRWHSSVPEEHELAFLPLDTEEGKAYMREMLYCVDYALRNRTLMVNRIIDAFKEVVTNFGKMYFINIAHNYAALENHFGKNVIVHRKGATSAQAGEIGIIPGSQGSKSYIVSGKGNPQSFQSCSHGAGRRMGRKQAQRELSVEAEIKRLDAMGVIHSIRGVSDLDEAPSAYKDITEVMDNQTDLVDIIVSLSPLAVIKG